MKKILLSGCILFVSSFAFPQHSLEKIWESDSLTLKGPESALYDPKTKLLYVSSMFAGTVVLMDLNGKVINNAWVKGLNANKGSGLFKNQFYTAETKSVAVVDVDKATIEKRIPIDSAVMLNDLAIDSKGVVYVSDTRTGKVYRIENDKPVLYLENMPGANGLLTVKDDLYVLTSTNFLKVNAKKEITTVAGDFESGLDGIVMVGENEFIISNYKGIIWYIKADGSRQQLLDTRSGGLMSNDIGYDEKAKILYVPSFRTNQVFAYKVN
jgi:DNA-binding beta-propeller fold protein YncE